MRHRSIFNDLSLIVVAVDVAVSDLLLAALRSCGTGRRSVSRAGVCHVFSLLGGNRHGFFCRPQESGLLLDSAAGRVLIVGCAHPGVVKMVKVASEFADSLVAARLRRCLAGFISCRIPQSRWKASPKSFERSE